jgi:LysR family transcriptional regulator, transcriptional activator of nhaA
MERLNYHHLLYFWTVAREGGVTRAAEKLELAQPTLSAQIHQLELDLGAKLFARSGRGLALTDMGRRVFRYAEEIFQLGIALQEMASGGARRRRDTLVVGLVEGLSGPLAQRLLQPLFQAEGGLGVHCRRGSLPDLAKGLAAEEVDLVLSHDALPSKARIRVSSHRLGESPLALFAAPALLRRHPGPFPRCLEGAPLLLPEAESPLRILLDPWLAGRGSRVAGEFQDDALLHAAGQEGAGFFFGPSVLAREIQRQYRVVKAGRAEGLVLAVHLLTRERKVRRPAVLALLRAAQREVFPQLDSGLTTVRSKNEKITASIRFVSRIGGADTEKTPRHQDS